MDQRVQYAKPPASYSLWVLSGGYLGWHRLGEFVFGAPPDDTLRPQPIMIILIYVAGWGGPAQRSRKGPRRATDSERLHRQPEAT